MTKSYWLHKLLDYVINNSDDDFHDNVVLNQLEAWVNFLKVITPECKQISGPEAILNDGQEGGSNIIRMYPYRDFPESGTMAGEEAEAIDNIFRRLRQAVGHDFFLAKALENKFELEIEPLYNRSKIKELN